MRKAAGSTAYVGAMEFRRITNLPPYVFTIIDGLKIEARRQGVDVIDLGFGNPDLPSPEIAVDKLTEAVHNPRNHRYSASRGIPKLRQAIASVHEIKGVMSHIGRPDDGTDVTSFFNIEFNVPL